MHDTVVLVAGASGGIGRAISCELLAAGVRVLLLGRDIARLEAAVPASLSAGAEFLPTDLTDLAAIEDLGARINRAGGLDGLVLCAGIYERSDDPQVFQQQIAANLLGPYALVRAVLPALLERRGQVVFVNSSQAHRASAFVGQYAATMHANKAIADSLRDEVNERGVRVISMYLGRTAGERQERIYAMENRPYVPDALIQPSDVARTLVYLLAMPRTAEVTDVLMRSMQKP